MYSIAGCACSMWDLGVVFFFPFVCVCLYFMCPLSSIYPFHVFVLVLSLSLSVRYQILDGNSQRTIKSRTTNLPAIQGECTPKLPLVIVVVVLLFYVHGKHLRSCRDGRLT